MSRTREERETVIRYDETEALAYLSTCSASQARRWQRAGVQLTQRGGEWLGRVEKAAVRGCRRVQPDGSVIKAKRQGGFGRSGTADTSTVGESNRPGAEPA